MGIKNVNEYDGQGKRTFSSPKMSAPTNNAIGQSMQNAAPSDSRNITTSTTLFSRGTDVFSSRKTSSRDDVKSTGGI